MYMDYMKIIFVQHLFIYFLKNNYMYKANLRKKYFSFSREIFSILFKRLQVWSVRFCLFRFFVSASRIPSMFGSVCNLC